MSRATTEILVSEAESLANATVLDTVRSRRNAH